MCCKDIKDVSLKAVQPCFQWQLHGCRCRLKIYQIVQLKWAILMFGNLTSIVMIQKCKGIVMLVTTGVKSFLHLPHFPRDCHLSSVTLLDLACV